MGQVLPHTLGRNQPCWRLDHRLPVPQTVRQEPSVDAAPKFAVCVEAALENECSDLLSPKASFTSFLFACCLSGLYSSLLSG